MFSSETAACSDHVGARDAAQFGFVGRAQLLLARLRLAPPAPPGRRSLDRCSHRHLLGIGLPRLRDRGREHLLAAWRPPRSSAAGAGRRCARGTRARCRARREPAPSTRQPLDRRARRVLLGALEVDQPPVEPVADRPPHVLLDQPRRRDRRTARPRRRRAPPGRRRRPSARRAPRTPARSPARRRSAPRPCRS